MDDSEALEAAVESWQLEVYKCDDGKYRFRLRSARDGGIVTVGQAHDTMEAAKKNACLEQRADADAGVVEADS